MRSSRWAWFFGLAAFLLNPSFACGSAEPEYQYGEAELRAAVEGDWSLSVPQSSGAPLELMLHVEQRRELTAGAASPTRLLPLLRSAHACGTRTLIAPARACIDSTEMPLSVRLLAGEPRFQTAALSGNFRVDSLVFDVGILQLALGELTVTAHVEADGTVSSAALDSPPGGDVSLQRVR